MAPTATTPWADAPRVPDRVETKMIGTRVPLDVIEMIDKESTRLGLTQSEFVRAAIVRQLGPYKMTLTEARRYQRPSTMAARRVASRNLTRRS